MRFERILVPVDFSAHSADAAELAARLAQRHEAALTLLHVDSLPGIAVLSAEPIYIPPELFEKRRAEHDRVVDRELETLRAHLAAQTPGVAISVERRMTHVVEGIVSYAAEGVFDLVVMGSRGQTGATRLILGSTAEKVSRAAPCPVLITRERSAESAASEPFQRVMVAIDYSEFSAPCVRLGAAVVGPGGSMSLVHVWYPPYLSALNATIGGHQGDLASAVEEGRSAQSSLLAEFSEEMKLERSVAHYVTTGSAPAGILEQAEAIDADLIVIGAHDRKSLGERVLGTTADRVLRHAEVPVLLLSEEALATLLR